MTKLLSNNRVHYNVQMKAVEVDGDQLQLPSGFFDKKGTVIDSGTTLTYLPSRIYEPLMTKVGITTYLTLILTLSFTDHIVLSVNQILSRQPALKLHTVEDQFTCFSFDKK